MENESKAPSDPMKDKKQVKESNDANIDKDFEGFPSGQAKEDIIHPQNEIDKKTAGLNRTPINDYQDNDSDNNESKSDGSGDAFSSTEEVED